MDNIECEMRKYKKGNPAYPGAKRIKKWLEIKKFGLGGVHWVNW